MTVEQEIAEIKTDIKWIKDYLRETRTVAMKNRGYLVTLIGAMIISTTSIVISLMR